MHIHNWSVVNVVAYFDLVCFIWELFCSLVAKNDIVHKINTLLMILWFKFLAILYSSRSHLSYSWWTWPCTHLVKFPFIKLSNRDSICCSQTRKLGQLYSILIQVSMRLHIWSCDRWNSQYYACACMGWVCSLQLPNIGFSFYHCKFRISLSLSLSLSVSLTPGNYYSI